MKYLLPLLLFFLSPSPPITKPPKETNYRIYHQKIIQAENQIFLEENQRVGLKLFKETFQEFDFVFVDDCIEAFQLALVFGEEEQAVFFLKRAMDNGLQLSLLKHLNCTCTHNKMEQMRQYEKAKKAKQLVKGLLDPVPVTIYQNFVQKHAVELTDYEQQAFRKYTSRIDRTLLQQLLNRHIKEQAYKQCGIEMGFTLEEKKVEYDKVCDSNLNFVQQLFKQGNYLGEKNLGLMNFQLLQDLNIDYLQDNQRLSRQKLQELGLSPDANVPIQIECSFFEINVLYNILFHNKKSHQALKKYKDEAMQLGYLHPREYASLEFHRLKEPEGKNMYLEKFWTKIEDKEELQRINQMRVERLLPSYEVDFKKHQFGHKYCLQLSFGFFKGTR